MSEQLLAELERALAYPQFRARITAEEAEEYVAVISRTAELVTDPGEVPRRTADPNDDYLLALAAKARVALVSGDRHLLALSNELPVYSPGEFLAAAG